MKKTKYLILDYDMFTESIINAKTCPNCDSFNIKIYNNREKSKLYKCFDCKTIFSESKIKYKNVDYDDYYTILNDNSSYDEKIKIFNFLKKYIFSFSNRKDIDSELLKFLNEHRIIININKDLNYRNIFDFLNNTKFEDYHCKNEKCNNETLFTGFKMLNRNPRGYQQFCSPKCYHEWFSEKQKGENNTIHRMIDDKKVEYKNKISKIMRDKIADGTYTPNIFNSWRNTKYEVLINGEVKKFRSAWEAFFNLVNPNLLYEHRRIPYIINDIKRTYIVDFEDYENKILYEIKPKSKENDERNVKKREYAEIWCNNNGYNYVIINEKWIKDNYSKFKYLLDGQKDEVRIKRNLRYYENKKNY